VAKPSVVMVATVCVPELHSTVPVMFCVLPSVKVPVAVNCWLAPSGIVGIAGVTAIEMSVAAVTVTVVEPVVVPDVAVILALPKAMLVVMP
jgi:hypothetical protein